MSNPLQLADVPGVRRVRLDALAAELTSDAERAGVSLRVVEQVGRFVDLKASRVIDDPDEFKDTLNEACAYAWLASGGNLRCLLLTDAQHSAESDAQDLDEDGYFAFFRAWLARDAGDTVAVRGGSATKSRDKSQRMATGTAGDVLMLLRELSPVAPLSREDLLAQCVARMPPMRDSRGDNRTRHYAKAAIAKLIKDGFAFEHPRECVGLAAP